MGLRFLGQNVVLFARRLPVHKRSMI